MNRLIAPALCLFVSPAIFAAPAPANRQMLLDLQPAPAPVPALKYQLLPEVAEMHSGNAVPAYLKCFAEQTNFFFKKESAEERETLLNCPLTDIKVGSLKDYGKYALKQADHAARLEYCDWNILPQLREQGYMLLLPEVQQMRTLASALAVRCRGQIVDRDYDGAVHTLKTIFALARHMSDHPTIVSSLVGAAMANIGLNLIEELIQQPRAPNLYWALTDLPPTLVDIRKGISGDRTIMESSFGSLMDNKRAWSPEDAAAAMKKATEIGLLLERSETGRKMFDQWLRDRLKDEAWLAAALKSLGKAGYPADKLEKYPSEQVLFYQLQRRTRQHQDEALKWMTVPYWQAEAALSDLQKEPPELEEKLAHRMMFMVLNVRGTLVRLEQRLAMLRVVEAMSVDAAKNGGKLPVNLSDLSVPIPNDPATGKSFAYKIDGITAMLEGKAIPNSGGGAMKYGYEVRIRK